MKIRVPYYYKDFKCIDKNCTDTCCAGWEVDLDDKAWDYYKTVTGPFGDRLKSVMVDDEEGKRFLLHSNKRCPFLNDENLCDLYTELGEDRLCDTCTNYPRFIEEYGSTREIGIALSCKVAANLILKDSQPTTFVEEQNDEMVTSYNDIDPELYMHLVATRTQAIQIMQNRDIAMNNRIAMILTYASEIQQCIDKNKLSKITDIKNRYAQPEQLEKRIREFHQYEKQESVKYYDMVQYMDLYKNIEVIVTDWASNIDHILETLHRNQSVEFYEKKYAEFDCYYKDKQYEYEHLMVYFLYRYYLQAVNDEDLLSKVKMGVVAYLVIKEMDIVKFLDNGNKLDLVDQIDIMYAYSREVEHSYENFELFEGILSTNELFDFEQLMIMLMN